MCHITLKCSYIIWLWILVCIIKTSCEQVEITEKGKTNHIIEPYNYGKCTKYIIRNLNRRPDFQVVILNFAILSCFLIGPF